jgi:azurin
MKIRLLSVAFFALLTAGCGKKDVPATVAASSATPTPSAASTGTPASTAAASAAAANAPAPAPAGSARVIEITGNDQMKFSVEKIEAKAGEMLKVVLTNAGMLPKEVMGHNWVLLKAGTDLTAFGSAAALAKDTGFIPAAMKDQVIASIPILGPKEKGEITFKAPAAGDYTFICSFPGHFTLMKGTLTVK